MRDEHVDELIDLYALGALEPHEQAAVDEHLDECLRCREQLEEAKRLVLLLAYTPDQHEPPPQLRGRVMRRVQHLQRVERAPSDSWWKRLFSGGITAPRLSPGLALAFSALLLAVGLWAVQLQRQVSSLHAELAHQQALIEVLTQPNTQLVTFAPETGVDGQVRLLVSPEGTSAYLVSRQLQPLPPDRTYQLWLIANDQPVSAGTFDVDQQGIALLRVQADRPLAEYDLAGITIEPEGGSAQPTMAPILVSPI